MIAVITLLKTETAFRYIIPNHSVTAKGDGAQARARVIVIDVAVIAGLKAVIASDQIGSSDAIAAAGDFASVAACINILAVAVITFFASFDGTVTASRLNLTNHGLLTAGHTHNNC